MWVYSITFVFAMEQQIQDQEFGTITLRWSLKAKYYTLKISNGKIIGILPSGGNEERMLAFIEEKRSVLKKALEKHPSKRTLNESSDWQTKTFRLHIFCTDRSNYYMKLEHGILHIACPQGTDFSKEGVQKVLFDLLGRALQHEANRLLPERLLELARTYGFTFSKVRITKTKSCWGSCNRKKEISLSRSLMLLPDQLSDYILLHELCHTIEMSHNERFWRLMDRVTEGKAKSFRKELKNYTTQ